MNYSVKQLIVFIAILLILVALGSSVASFFLLQDYYHTEDSRVEVLARQRLNLTANMLGNQILFYQEVVDLLAGRGNTVDLLSFSDDEEVEKWSLQIRTILPGAFGLALARQNGQIIGDPLIQRIGSVCQDDLRHFANLENLSYPPYHNEVRGLEHFDLFARIEAPSGEDGGVLLVSFHTDTLLRMLQRTLAPGDVFSIYTTDGRDVARTGPAGPNETLLLTTDIPNTPWKIRLQTTPIAPERFFYQLVSINLVMLVIVIGLLFFSTRRFARLLSQDMQRIQNRISSALHDEFDPDRNQPVIQEIASLIPDIDRISETLSKQHHHRRLDHSLTDPLTGLYNRAHFDIMLTHAFKQSMRRDAAFLLLIDINKFELANDLQGLDISDQILHDLSACLRRSTRNSDEIARLGGSEFAIILHDIADNDIEAWARDFSRRYDRELSVRRPLAVEHHCCTLSIGIVWINARCYQSIDEVMVTAKQAMKVARKNAQPYRYSGYHIATSDDPGNGKASTT